MLAPPDLDLVRRDPALPGLATLLDADAFLDALRDSAPVAVLGARITYVRYKPGMNCVAAYRLETAAGPLLAYGKAHGPDADVKIAKACQRAADPTSLGAGRIVLPKLGLVISIFPNDSKLQALTRWGDRELWAALGIGGPADSLAPLRYKPERRFVARADVAGRPVAAIKGYAPAGFRAALRNAGRFADQGALRLPARIGQSKPLGALAFAWVDGRPLDEAIRSGEMETVAWTGAALAEVHRQGGAGKKVSRAREEAALRAAAKHIGRLRPDLDWRAHETAGLLVERIETVASPGLRIHGDFHCGQVLVREDGRPLLLDLDRTTRGDPAADLGNLLAHLERDVTAGSVQPGRIAEVRQALLAGYGSDRGLPADCGMPGRVQLHTAAGLFRLCVEPFRYRAPDWPRRMADLLERARLILNEGVARCPAA
jgi:hypothetical protein